MGIKILGLALLKFFVLACGACPFKGLFLMSIPIEPVGVFHHLPALSPPLTVCRQDSHSVRWNMISCYHFDWHSSCNN